jgi:4-amino-4-deoxy-L-arabinose transferase-like glycosyltransferase
MDNASIPSTPRSGSTWNVIPERWMLGLLRIWDALGSWRDGLVYLIFMTPFATFRQLRIHGDEKVYVGQALEMFRSGHYWQQLQFGDVNYIKGPLHYLFLIAGQAVFGLSMLATVYMNLLLGALAVVALRSASRFLFPEHKPLQFLPAVLFASSGTYLLFTFSSQMESELTSLYAIAMALCVLARFKQQSLFYFLLWVVVGAAGALKSPLHSCLLGLSVVAYFCTYGGGWRDLLFSRSRIAFALLGVCICGTGYVIPYLFDRSAWISGYILREQVNRPQFADSVSGFFLNNFVLHLIPWCFVALPAAVSTLRSIRNRSFTLTDASRTGLCFVLPTLLFFSIGGYVAPWYGLPMLSGIVLVLVSQIFTHHGAAHAASHPAEKNENAANFEMDVMKSLSRSLMPWLALVLIAVLLTHVFFAGETTWWTWHATALCMVLLGAAFWVLAAHSSGRNVVPHTVVVPGIAMFWAAVLVLSSHFGEAELTDARNALREQRTALTFSNLSVNNYNEWGYMGHMLGAETHYALSNEQLLGAARAGNWLVFPGIEELNAYWLWLDGQGLKSEFMGCSTTRVWRRWPRNAVQFRELWNRNVDTENIWDRSTRQMILYGAKSC